MKPEPSGELTIGDTVERAGDPAYPFPGVIVGTYDGGFVVAHAVETGLKHIFSAKMLKRRDPNSLPACYDALRAQAPSDADVERVARALHTAFEPFCDNHYPWDNPLSSQDMFRTLALAALPTIAEARAVEPEFICRKCGQRQDAPSSMDDPGF